MTAYVELGLIIRQEGPTNLETPFDQVDSFLTPTEQSKRIDELS